jgi:hypothetical protein
MRAICGHLRHLRHLWRELIVHAEGRFECAGAHSGTRLLNET